MVLIKSIEYDRTQTCFGSHNIGPKLEPKLTETG